MTRSHRLVLIIATLSTVGNSFGFQSQPSHPAIVRTGWRKSTPLSTSFLHLLLQSNSDNDDGGGGVCAGPILEPSTTDPKRFDAACVANPVVLPPSREGDKWQMYYYGNAGSWNRGLNDFLPTGWCGLAESDDGIHWTKVDGSSCDNGAILGPSDDLDEWDSVQIGVGDVIRVPPGDNVEEEELHMYYFGGSSEPIGLGNVGSNMELVGFRMRIGRAKSVDGGRTWVKMGACLDIDDSEGIFASWPRIILPSKEGNPYRMIYHAYNGKKWRVFGAESFDQGSTWKRTGLVLEGNNDDEDSFDYSGIGTRTMAPWRDGLLMIYEGVGKSGKHRLGAAFCDDPDGNAPWEKLRVEGCCSDSEQHQQLGGPILEPGVGAMGSWTETVVGTPYLVNMPGGGFRLYFVGKGGDKGHSIGVLYSETGDISPDSWQSLS